MTRLLFLTLSVFLVSGLYAVPYTASPKEKHPYIIVAGEDEDILQQNDGRVVSDSVFYKISKSIQFPVNKFEIPKDSPLRSELKNDIMPFATDDYTLEAVLLRGAASPEGPYEWNQTLSHLRRNALLNVIKGCVGHHIDSCLTVNEVPEDYICLLMLMKEKGDKDYSRVSAAVDKYFATDQARLKQRLMSMDGGALWKRMIREYFPQMRSARVVLVFRKVKQPEPAKPAEPVVVPPVKVDTVVPAPAIEKYDTIEAAELLPSYMPRREVLSVKSNLLFDFAYVPGYNRWCPIPNIAVEYYPLHGHFTYGASLDFPWWQHYSDHKYFQIRNYQFEARYYLRNGGIEHTGVGKGAAYRGLYLQAYANLAIYGICFDKNRGWEGEGAGAGLGVGYVLPLCKSGHWRLEVGAQVGVFFTKYDPYQWQSVLFPEREDKLYYYKWNNWGNFFHKRRHSFTWAGPTRVGVTLTYDLLYRRIAKKGYSLKNKEVQQ